MSGTASSLGLDFGTSSVRALIVRTQSGEEIGLGETAYAHGNGGVLGDPRDPLVARQRPGDWTDAMTKAVAEALADASRRGEFSAASIIGIGLDATASTPLPVDERLRPLDELSGFAGDPGARAWLWKDHTAHAEAAEITAHARKLRPQYLRKCGGTYSSEWYWSKLLRALRTAPRVMEASAAWVEQGDWLVAVLTGAKSPAELPANACAAGHKALWHDDWGYPDAEFLDTIDPRLGKWSRDHALARPAAAGTVAGQLSPQWGERLGLPPGRPVSIAAIDAHVGAVGAGIRPGVLVKILGTSGCDMVVHPLDAPLADIPGLCGIARDSIVPGYHGLEAGQAALGDLFEWFVREFTRGAGLSHQELTAEAARLRPGESGLVALDWNNGNRTVLADPRLTGLLVGQTLGTGSAAVYRALLEATGFGARVIMERFEEFGVPIEKVVACGGIAEKNELLLDLYADITGRPIALSRSGQTCALGAAIFGSVAAGERAGGHDSVEAAQDAMTGLKDRVHSPDPSRSAVYDRLFAVYRTLHDVFGGGASGEHSGAVAPSEVMKELISLREEAQAGE